METCAAGRSFYTGRRPSSIRVRGEPAPARTGGGHGLSDHLHADGPRRLSGLGPEVARDAGDATDSMSSNMAMHDCDLMICIGARFDDRITGRLDAFSPGSLVRRIFDIDPSLHQQGGPHRFPHRGRRRPCAEDMLKIWREPRPQDRPRRADRLVGPDPDMAQGETASHSSRRGCRVIKTAARAGAARGTDQGHGPLHLHRGRPAPDVGGAVSRLRGSESRWMTSGGLGTMGYGHPASIGVQLGHPDSLRHTTWPERRSWLMNMQELGNRGAVPPAGQAVHPQQTSGLA